MADPGRVLLIAWPRNAQRLRRFDAPDQQRCRYHTSQENCTPFHRPIWQLATKVLAPRHPGPVWTPIDTARVPMRFRLAIHFVEAHAHLIVRNMILATVLSLWPPTPSVPWNCSAKSLAIPNPCPGFGAAVGPHPSSITTSSTLSAQQLSDTEIWPISRICKPCRMEPHHRGAKFWILLSASLRQCCRGVVRTHRVRRGVRENAPPAARPTETAGDVPAAEIASNAQAKIMMVSPCTSAATVAIDPNQMVRPKREATCPAGICTCIACTLVRLAAAHVMAVITSDG
jgi:hypothetical protein